MENIDKIRRKSELYWNRVFKNSTYDFQKLTDPENWTNFLKKIKHYNVSSVLDSGCGGGHWSIVLARSGIIVKSIDFAESAIEKLNSWVKKKNLLNLYIQKNVRYKTTIIRIKKKNTI